jgi:acyl carrier protein
MNKEKFLILFQEALEIEEHVIEFEDKFKDYEEWDSLAFLSLQALINREFNITIPKSEIDGLNTINELYKLIQSKL